MALTRLHRSTDLSEPSLVRYAIKSLKLAHLMHIINYNYIFIAGCLR